MESSIFAQIRKENQDFYDSYISVVPGYSYNQYETLKRCYLYLNSKFEDGTLADGMEKLFFNIILPPCEVATRMLNVDTKNIRLWPTNPKSYYSTFLLEKELKLWLKKSKMGKLLNTLAEEAPRFGSVVLEKTKDGAKAIDLRRLILDPTVDNITDSRFVTTVHYMTPSQLRETGWDEKAIEDAIERFGDTNAMEAFEDEYGNVNQMHSTPYIKIHKRYGEVEEWMLGKGKSDKLVRSLFIVAGADSIVTNDEGKPIGDNGVVLFKSVWHKKWPFKDFHYSKVRGRWLGVGITEMLFDAQVRMNELKHTKRVSMVLSTMHLFQTKDNTIVKNALTDLKNGDILISRTGIEPVANEERNIPAFKDEEESYKQLGMSLSFANEAVNGQPMAASTPATNALIAQQGATSVYAFKRENMALFLQDFFNELVLPQLMNDLNEDHIMRFVGSAQELQKITEAALDICANDYVKENLLAGKVTTPEELDAFKQQKLDEYRKMGEQRFIKIKKGLYTDAEFEFDFIIGNEQADPATLVQNTQAVFMAVAQNPMVLEDPRIKMLFYKFAENLGVSPAEIELADQQAQNIPQQPQQDQMMQQPLQSPIQPKQPLPYGSQ